MKIIFHWYKNNYRNQNGDALVIIQDTIDKNCPYMISVAFGPKEYNEVQDWCEENMSNQYCLWTNCFQCGNKEDMVAFKLRWI